LAEAAQVGFLSAGERKFVHRKIARSFVVRAQVRLRSPTRRRLVEQF
jgi:hypothetical protein